MDLADKLLARSNRTTFLYLPYGDNYHMKLDIKALALTLGILWGVFAMFLTGIANMIWPSYGQEFLKTMASVYPGYGAAPIFGQVILGTLYGLADGAIAGAVFAWLYNRFVSAEAEAERHKQT